MGYVSDRKDALIRGKVKRSVQFVLNTSSVDTVAVALQYWRFVLCYLTVCCQQLVVASISTVNSIQMNLDGPGSRISLTVLCAQYYTSGGRELKRRCRAVHFGFYYITRENVLQHFRNVYWHVGVFRIQLPLLLGN